MRSSRAFSLLEVIITVAVFSTALVFILRAFTTLLFAARRSQDITQACFLAQNKLWEIEWANGANAPLPDKHGSSLIQEKEFTWDYQVSSGHVPGAGLSELDLTVSWPGNAGRSGKIDIATYIACR